MPFAAELKKDDIIRVTVEPVSGTMSNAIIVLELFNDAMSNPDGKRHVADIISGGTFDIPISSDRAASEISNYKFWLYRDAVAPVFNNFKFRIKMEVYNGSDIYTASGRNIFYGQTYGALPTPQRNDAEFIGWFTEPYGGTQVYSSTSATAVGKQTLYAHWKEIEAEFVYGIYPGITAEKLENDFLKLTNVTYSYENVNGCITTGTLVTATDKTTGKTVAKYILVLFGDVNSDGWYDGQDAVYTEAIREGMLNADNLSEAALLAADCNHDGFVGFTDTTLLRKAGVFLEGIDQSKPIEVLSTMSEWQEYISIIDQEPEITEPDVSEPEEEEMSAVSLIMKWLNYISGILEIVFGFIFN